MCPFHFSTLTIKNPTVNPPYRPPEGAQLNTFAGHVIQRILNPRSIMIMPSYDAASDIRSRPGPTAG